MNAITRTAATLAVFVSLACAAMLGAETPSAAAAAKAIYHCYRYRQEECPSSTRRQG